MKEKTISSSPKRVKGTVLFTVVAVMMVLIVFLMGTLALAATASNRAYANYQKAQTQATARAVLDSAIKAVNAKEEFRKTISSGTTKIAVTLDGADYEVNVTKSGEQQLFDTEAQKWVNGNIYEFTTTVSKNMADTTYSLYALANGNGEVVESPPPSGGAFVALGNLGVDNIGTQGYVMGGTEIGVGNTEMKKFWTENEAKIQAPFYVNGHLGIGTQNEFEFTKIGDYFVVTGDLENKNVPWFKSTQELRDSWNSLPEIDYNKVPYIYVGGKLSNGGNNTWNFILHEDPKNKYSSIDYNAAHPLNNDDLVAMNLYVNELNITSGIALYGDLYAFGDASENLIQDYGYKSALYEWTERTIKNSDGTTHPNLWGNYYSKNNTVMNGQNNVITIQGECRVAGKLTVKGNNGLEVAGDVVCDTLVVESGSKLKCANVYANNISVNGQIQATETRTNSLGGGGSITGTVYAGSVAEATSTTTTVTYTTVSEVVDTVPNAEPWNTSITYRYTWTGTKTTAVNGVVTEEIVYDDANPFTFTANNGYWMSQEQTLQTNEDYKKIKAGSSSETLDVPSYGGGTVNPLSGDALDGCGDIYPEDYTKDNIENNILTKPKASSYSNFPTTLDKVDENIPIYVRDPSGDIASPKTLALGYYTGGKITTSCILKAGSYDKIYVDPASSDPIVILVEGKVFFSDPGGFVINDNKGTVYFFLEDGAELNFGKTGILTTDYYKILTGNNWDESKLGSDLTGITKNMVSDFEVNQVCASGSDKFPNVVVWAGTDTAINISNNDNPITANIRAPYLRYSQAASNANTGSHHVTYVQKDDITGETIKSDTIYLHLIGQLIADEISLENQWGMLYVTSAEDADEDPEDPEDPGDPSDGDTPKIFSPVYYNLY